MLSKQTNSETMLQFVDTGDGIRLVTEDGQPWCPPIAFPLAAETYEFLAPEDVPEGERREILAKWAAEGSNHVDATPVANSAK